MTHPTPSGISLVASPDATRQFAAQVEAAAAARKPIRARIGVQLYDVAAHRYAHWQGMKWTLEVPATVESGQLLAQALHAFFAALALLGPAAVTQTLAQASLSTLPGVAETPQP